MRSLTGLLFASLVVAHGGVPGAPTLLGRRAVSHLRNRGLLPRALERAAFEARSAHAAPEPNPAASTNTDGPCGTNSPSGASCAAGYCCSPAGWCGQGSDYCAAPGCQFYYGPGCDQNTLPPGPSTSDIARPLLGSQPYGGAGIYDCVNAGDVALTYDDGPYIYTGHILDILDQYNAKATFFITGNNNGKGEIDNVANGWSTLIQRMDSSGHHIASHTWSHNDLSLEFKTSADRKKNMYQNEMALRNILGKFPTYMRPPYSSCTSSSGCESDLKALGYHVVYFDIDTDDYDQDSPSLIQNSKNWFSGNLSMVNSQTGNALVIAHDIHQQTAYNLTEYMLQTLLSEGFKPVTVGECLGDPATNWYRADTRGGVFTSTTSGQAASSTTTTTAAVASATIVSTTAECGGTSGLTCAGSTFGNCCSANGWCGSTDAYCGTGCQSAFGLCGAAASSPVSSAATTTATSTGTSTTTSTPSSVASAPSPSATLVISPDATCGGTSGHTCQGSTFGNCCSVNGWCGSTDAYCGTGCQSGFGSCGSSVSSKVTTTGQSSTTTTTTTTPKTSTTTQTSTTTTTTKTSTTTPSSTTTTKTSTTTTKPSTTLISSTTTTTTKASSTTTTTTKVSSTTTSPTGKSTALPVSTNGQCGAKVGQTCAGSKYGDCCGAGNTCSTSYLNCVSFFGCQSKYGQCLY